MVRWRFLCSVAARRAIAFHGTGDLHIERFEPREPVDFAPFGRQRAIFATSDPIWIHGHNDERLADYARAVMAAAPWPA